MATSKTSLPQSNIQLVTTVKQAICQATGGPAIRNLKVTEDSDGSITIRGTCSTFYTKQLAQNAALSLVDPEKLNISIKVL